MTKLESLIKNLKQANQKLAEAVKAKPTSMNKDATIQRFEFTFELSWKTVQAYIIKQGFDCKSPRNCFRKAAELEIINNPQIWFVYLDSRNLIAHTYNEKMADKVYKKAVKFPQEIDRLLKKIS